MITTMIGAAITIITAKTIRASIGRVRRVKR
jgi:hypothetical protein